MSTYNICLYAIEGRVELRVRIADLGGAEGADDLAAILSLRADGFAGMDELQERSEVLDRSRKS